MMEQDGNLIFAVKRERATEDLNIPKKTVVNQQQEQQQEGKQEEKSNTRGSPVIKSQPNFVFATWLVKMVGQKHLREGSGVIDIAGGNGLLSFELSCRYGIPSTVLDPREMKFNSILRRRMKKLTKNRLKEYHSKGNDTVSAPTITTPHARRIQWDNAVIKVEDDCHVLHRVQEAVAERVDMPFQQYQVYYEGTDSPITACRQQDMDLLSSASIFVGMHPGT
jgi:hypothetical protein